MIIIKKLESMGYQPMKAASSYRFIRFDTIPACDGRTDRQTDRNALILLRAVTKQSKASN